MAGESGMDDVLESMEQTLNETSPEAEATAAETATVIADDDLEGLRRQAKSLQARLSAVTVADRLIIDAERHCASCEAEWEELKQQAAEAKKRFDAAVESLREKIRARATGMLQTRLDYGDEPEQPIAEPAAQAESVPEEKKKRKGRKKKADSEQEPSAESIPRESDEETERPAVTDVAVPNADFDSVLDVPLDAVSVMDGDKMLSIPSSMISFLVEAGVRTVREAQCVIDDGTKIPGVGNTGRGKLTAILKAWVESGGGEERVASAPVAKPADKKPAAPKPGEPTGTLCADCRTPAPLGVKKCPSCSSEALYVVGYFGASGCDIDGDFVNAEELGFEVTTSALAGTRASVMLVEHHGWRGGYEIRDENGNVVDSHYPNILDNTFPERAACLRQWAFALDLVAENYCENGKQLKAFREAAHARLGIDTAASRET